MTGVLPMQVPIPEVPVRLQVDTLSHMAQQRALLVLRMHVMDSVRRRVEAGQRDFISEIRTCTMVFVGFPSLKVNASCMAVQHDM